MVATMALCLKIIDLGCGLHIWAIPPPTLVSMFKQLYAVQLIYTTALWLCRVSGLAFYSRLCKDVTRFRTHMWLASIFVTAVFIAQFLILALQCIPIQALWHDGPGQCMTTRAAFISTAAMTITCDSIIMLIPVRIIWDLKMNRRRKILLALTLLVGVLYVLRPQKRTFRGLPLTTRISSVRWCKPHMGTLARRQLRSDRQSRTSIFRIIALIPGVREADATWYYAIIAAWSSTEVCAAVIALSVPALKPLLGHWLRSGSTADSKGYSNVDTTGASKNGSSYGLKSFRPPKPSGLSGRGRTSSQSLSEENLWANGHGHGQVHNNIHGNTSPGDQDGVSGIVKTVEVHVKVRILHQLSALVIDAGLTCDPYPGQLRGNRVSQ